MNDILPPSIHLWHRVEAAIRSLTQRYGYNEARTPLVESTDLFKRGVGADTDIVEKEMYTFADRNGDSLSLRPEGTASVVRAVVEHSLLNENPTLKLYYVGPMYRHERPQKGRYRQFYQFGIEYFGPSHAYSDVEVMALGHELLVELKVSDLVRLEVSSVGCENCRPSYKDILSSKLEAIKSQIPEDFHPRIKSNPQRIFDHKDEKVKALTKDLPVLLDHICTDCRSHLETAKEGLERLQIPFVINPKIVRGLDYYQRTAFEFVSDHLGAQSAVGGGGRYNKLVGELGGPETASVGFGIGMERLLLLLEQKNANIQDQIDAFFVYPDEQGQGPCFESMHACRQAGLSCDMDQGGRSMKAQIKRADKLGAKYLVIIGSSELTKNVAIIKNMAARTQQEISLNTIVPFLKSTREI